MSLANINQIPVTDIGESVRGFRVVKQFLLDFGYLRQVVSPVTDELDVGAEEALKRYQRFFSLEDRSGRFTEETRRKMASPRCSRVDPGDVFPPQAECVVRVRRWRQTVNKIPYFINSPSVNPPLAPDDVAKAVRDAFDFWVQQTRVPLTFTPSSVKDAFLNIDWILSGDYPSARLGGGKIAYCDFPPNSGLVDLASGDPKLHMLFDLMQPWSLQVVQARFHILTVALHEIGHLLGLDHCGHDQSIMNPNMPLGGERLDFQGEDKEAIALLYS